MGGSWAFVLQRASIVMHTHQLAIFALAGALIPASACSRADTDADARRASAGIREAASRAGDRLADAWLTTKVQAQYLADEDIKARYINVSTRAGVVTLAGRVDNARAREQALNIARSTDGVTRVEDQLTVASAATAGPPPEMPPPADSGWAVATTGTLSAHAGTDRIDDAVVMSRIQARYFLDPFMKARRIEVGAREGVVTLRGELASDDERAQALLLARTTEGVERVEDALTVDAALAPAGVSGALAPATHTPPRSDDEALAARVRSRWSAEPDLRALSIQATAKDGVLLLEGAVSTAAAEARVLSVARGTRGVVQVIDRVRVSRTR